MKTDRECVRRASIALCGLLFSVLSCGLGQDGSAASDPGAIASSAQPLAVYGLPDGGINSAAFPFVPSQRVSVCFNNVDGVSAATFAYAQSQVVSALVETWQAASALVFTDLGTCTSQTSSSVQQIDLRQYDPNLGDGGLAMGAGRCAALSGCWIGIADPNAIRRTAVHELGHALGFGHEHQRAVMRSGGLTWEEPLCPTELWREDAGLPGERTPEPGLQGITPFDPFSIMNYCAGPNGRLATDYSLTPLDALGVEIVYPTTRLRQPRLSGAAFWTSSGRLVRSDTLLLTDWEARGATKKVFGPLSIAWRVDNLPATYGSTFPLLLLPNYGSGAHVISGTFNDLFGFAQQVAPLPATSYRLSDSLHTALLRNIVLQ